jgi:hypothetical protein
LIDHDISNAVLVWWATLAAIGVVGIMFWTITALGFARRYRLAEPTLRNARQVQLILAAVYAFGCAFRAILPRADVQRICLYDSWLSSVFVGRSVATVAEICFVIQWALILREAARNDGARVAAVTSRVLVPMIVVAEICSWYAVVTTNFIGNIVEQSLWTFSVGLLTISLGTLLRQYRGRLRALVGAWTVTGVGFVIFMTHVDLPMYTSRWIQDELTHRQYLSFSTGLIDLATRWTVTFDWGEWKDEMAWMTLYFSAGVWASISLVYTPHLARSVRKPP